jgi:hypothetical protein
MLGVDKKTVLRLLAQVGDAYDAYLNETMRNLKSERIQCDEVWSSAAPRSGTSSPTYAGLMALATCGPGPQSIPTVS